VHKIIYSNLSCPWRIRNDKNTGTKMTEKTGQLPINVEQQCRLRLENQLCFQIYSASRAMTQAYRPLLKAIGLTYPQYLVMLVLWEKQAQSEASDNACPLARSNVSQLGKDLRLDSGTLSPLLKRMEQQGLLSRQRSVEDERQLEVILSQSGIALSEQAAQVPVKLLCDLDISKASLWALKQQLEQLQDKLNN
jgi:DNA-binding MarR family transcriptional regulator